MTRGKTITLLVVLMLVASACGNDWSEGVSTAPGLGEAPPKDTSGSDTGKKVKVDAPGITDREIRVGGVASVTNPLGGPYGDSFVGVQAYFDKINDEGGIYGRQLTLVSERDDKLSNNQSDIRALISQDKVFAVLPIASLLFTGADTLVRERVPAFGWTINPEWEGSKAKPRDNLFGQSGSFLCFDCASPVLPWLARRVHAHKIGLLSYSVAQSSDCADGVRNAFKKFGKLVDAEVAFVDQSLAFGAADLSVQVSRMKRKGVDLVTTCMDQNGVVTLAKEMKKQELDAIQYLPNAYNHGFLEEFGDLFEGSYVRTDFVQFEVEDPPKGLKDYLDAMEAADSDPNESSLVGWVNAAQFVAGLKAAGPKFDREKVIAGINRMKDFDADGILDGVDWTKQHTGLKDPGEGCQFLSRIDDSEFDPILTKPGKPFICIRGTKTSLKARYTA